MPFKFERLEVWKEAMDLGELINGLTSSFPTKEMYNLSSQIRRAGDSIALNIAEGSSAATNPEQIKFLNIAIRSANEVVCCLYKARSRNYFEEKDFILLYQQLERLVARLQAFRNALKK